MNTNKESESQLPKGHCQAETSALQYTPHNTDTAGKRGAQREGQEGGGKSQEDDSQELWKLLNKGAIERPGKSTCDQHMPKNQTILQHRR